MSLEKWAEYSWLRAEATSRDEIRCLLGIVSRDLENAQVETISDDRRFEAAFSAARTAANAALRACGYRTAVQAGHHIKTIESLEFAIQAEPRLIHKLKVRSKKRNATSYDSAGNVSERELDQAAAVAFELRQSVIAWLREKHSGLLGDRSSEMSG